MGFWTRPKLALLATIGISALLIGLGYLVLNRTTSHLQASIENELSRRAQSLAELLGRASEFQLSFRGTGAEIEDFVDSVRAQKDVAFVVVTLPNNEVVQERLNEGLADEETMRSILGDAGETGAVDHASDDLFIYRLNVEYGKPVESGYMDDMGEWVEEESTAEPEKKLVGVAYVALSKVTLRGDVSEAEKKALWSMVYGVLIAMVIVAWVTFWVTKPIRGMVEAAQAMAAGEYEDLPDLGARRFETREISQLATAFGSMRDRFAEIAGQARRIAEGDLSSGVEGGGKLGAAFNAMVESLAHLVGQIKKASLQIASSSSEILAASKQAEKGSTEQASSIAQTTTTMDELLSASKQIATSADAVVQIAEKTLSAAQAGEEAVHESIRGMTEIADNNRQTAERTLELSEKNQEIGNVVDLIDEIADKSDLLALNAAIEGAKAGEAGKGFAVVATEMRALAENVISSTKEIKGLISEIQKASNASVLATEGQMKATERGTGVAEKTASHLQQILQMVEQTTEAAKQISLATQQQRTGTEQVVQSTSEIAKIAKSNVAGAAQTTSSTVELASLADELRQAVSRFRLGSDEA
jgi:methyl-accepting chemotaxis protein